LVSRKTFWEWKTGKTIPKPKTIAKIKDKKLKEEAAIFAIKKYIPFVSKEKLILELIKETNE